MASAADKHRQFWILQDDRVTKECREEYDKIRSKAKAIAGETSNYDVLSKNLAEFRDLASRWNLLEQKEAKEFLDHGDRLVAFGAGWNQTVTKVNKETFKTDFASEFVAKLQVQLTKIGGKLDTEAKATLKQVVEQEVQSRQQSTIQALSEVQATRLDTLKKSLTSSYEALLKLLNK